MFIREVIDDQVFVYKIGDKTIINDEMPTLPMEAVANFHDEISRKALFAVATGHYNLMPDDVSVKTIGEIADSLNIKINLSWLPS